MNQVEVMLKYKTLFIPILFLMILSCKKTEDSRQNPPKKFSNEYRADLAFDSDIILSHTEHEVDSILTAIRKEQLTEINQKKINLFGRTFEQNKDIIESSPLFKILSAMPKGGLLHIHSGGISNIKWLIKTAKRYKECYVFLKKDNKNYLYGQLAVFKENSVPEGFVNLQKKLKADSAFEEELYSLLTLTRFAMDEYTNYWIEFEKRFARISTLLAYRPFFKEYYERACDEMLNNNIQHLEIRFIFDHLYDLEKQEYPVETIVEDLKGVLTKIQKKSPEFTLKLIYTSFKFLDKPAVREDLIAAFELKKKYPEMIVGFDLVAEEEGHYGLSYYQENWQLLDTLENRFDFEMPLVLHAGESNSATNRNLFSIPALNNKRIGHGLNLLLFPELIPKIKEMDNLIEISPVSNLVLGYVNDIRNHPARVLLKNGIQGALSNDDPGVFGYEGLAYDFWYVFIGWELDLKAIKKLVFNSIEYSSLSKTEKEKSLKELTERWNSFIKQTLKTYQNHAT